jgi:5-bromo-4-chloroindolyl phosphate hydrolysis protein
MKISEKDLIIVSNMRGQILENISELNDDNLDNLGHTLGTQKYHEILS